MDKQGTLPKELVTTDTTSHNPLTSTTSTSEEASAEASGYSNFPSLYQPYTIQSSDVVRIVAQFCKEQGLTRTLRTLQDETGVSLDTLSNPTKFSSDFLAGHWDRVLDELDSISLPHQVVCDLFEHICFELCELREFDTANAIFSTHPSMQYFANNNPDRYNRLKSILANKMFSKEVYGGSKQQRRADLHAKIMKNVKQAPNQRLLTLLGQALKYQQSVHIGVATHPDLSLFYDASIEAQTDIRSDERWVAAPVKQSKLAAVPTCAVFLPLFGNSSEQLILIGLQDGFLEIWDAIKGKKAKHISYQQNDEYMVHSASIACIDVSTDGEVCASVSSTGEIKIWALRTGQVLRRIVDIHSKSINTVAFSPDHTQILTSGDDGVASLIGLKSGKRILLLSGHKGAVTGAAFLNKETYATCGTDGQVLVFNGDGMLARSLKVSEHGITHMHVHPVQKHIICVTVNTNEIYLINTDTMSVFKTLTVQVQNDTRIPKLTHCMFNNNGSIVYASGDDNILYAIRCETGKLVSAIKPHASGITGMVHHAHRNLVATYSTDKTLRTWKP